MGLNPGYLEKNRCMVFVGAASSRDHLISRLEAAPTSVSYSYVGLPDKYILNFYDLLSHY